MARKVSSQLARINCNAMCDEGYTMLTGLSERIYVAELTIPSCFYPSGETRRPISDPNGFGISKGYYIVRTGDNSSAVGGYTDMVLVVEFVCPGLREAEDHALKVGQVFSSLVSAYGAYPLQSPRLQRLATMDIAGNLMSEHHYWHRREPYMLSAFDQTVDHQFQQYIQSISSIDEGVQRQLQSAIHWYGISISTDEPTVSYVAAWTGLECVGTVLDDIAHHNGARARCETCNNKPGEKRDRKMAGIQHIFNGISKGPLSTSLSKDLKERLSRELRRCFSPDEAHRLRSQIVHGLEGLEPLREHSADLRLHVIHALNASIQTIMGVQAKSWLPGSDYGVHPDARYSLRFKGELKSSPYQGEWQSTLHGKVTAGSESEKESPQRVQEFELEIKTTAAGFVEFRGEDVYKRDDDIFRLPPDPDWNEHLSWFERLNEPEWKEFITSDLIDPGSLPKLN